MKKTAAHLRLALLILLFSALSSGSSFAVSSKWVEFTGGKARLVLAELSGGDLRAGLEFRLEPGWKTYWRYPGEAGIPTILRFEGSENLEGLEVKWPFPVRYDDGFSESIVYEGHTVLPVSGRRMSTSVPSLLAAELELGICRDICMPLSFEVSLLIPPFDQRSDPNADMLDSFAATVPSRNNGNLISLDADPGVSDRLIIRIEKQDKRSPVELFAAAHGDDYPGVPAPGETFSGGVTFTLSRNGLSADGGLIDLVWSDGSERRSATLRYPAK